MPKPGKHTPYFELLDAQAQPGCSICRMVNRATSQYLDAILYEAVLDPDVRAKIKVSRGFCADHVEMLRHMPGRALGISLIYRDTIRALRNSLHDARPPGTPSWWRRLLRRTRLNVDLVSSLSPQGACPACGIAAEAARNNLELLVAHLDDERLAAAYASSDGLCLHHLTQAVSVTGDAQAFRALIDPQEARYTAMLSDLDEYIRKRDHRFSQEKYGLEGDVWLRAMNAIVGGVGMGLVAGSGGRGQGTDALPEPQDPPPEQEHKA